jgi:hypothetical protein
MRRLLESWRLLVLVVVLAALAGENARAQVPPRKSNDPPGEVPKAVVPPGFKGTGPKVGPAAKPVAGQAPAAAPKAPPAPIAPFKLSPAEQLLLDETLKRWEERNSKIKTFKCTFRRWEYDNSFADDLESARAELAKIQAEAEPNSDKRPDSKTDPDRVAVLQQLIATLQRVVAPPGHCLRSDAEGVIKYKPPDQGMFRVTKLKEFDPNVKRAPKAPLLTEVKENLEHWVCDGKAIHEFKPPADGRRGEHLIHVIPEEMRGEAIADGPVPFIFGAKADKLKARYWLREATPPEEKGQHVWLEVYPKFQHDAANFRRVKVVLKAADHSLHGLMIELPSGKQQSTFLFEDIVINDFFGGVKGDFDPPKTPRGWVPIIDPPAETPTANKPDAQNAGKREAKRDPAPPARR